MSRNEISKVGILCNGQSSLVTDRVELIEALHRHNVQPYIAGVYDGMLNEYYCKENAVFLPIIAFRNNTNPINEIKSIFSVRRQIKNENIDAVIVYGVKNHPAMAIGAHLGGAKKIICVVNGSGNLFRLEGIKGKVVRFMSFPMLRIAYRNSSAVCFQNSDDLKLFQNKRIIQKNKNVFLTNGSGVNIYKFPERELPNENRFLFLSRITATKGINEYIEAARVVKETYKNAIFDIVGPLDSTVEDTGNSNLTKAINDGIVEYHGATDDVPKWMSRCRYFIYPSYYPEGVPRCVLQAMSTGRPIITCNTPGCRVTVKDGENGILIEPQNVKQLAEAMIFLIENKEITENMSRASRKMAEDNFNVRKINEEIISSLM